MVPLSALATAPAVAALPAVATVPTVTTLPTVAAFPLVEIEFPWDPPALTRLPPMYLFGGLIAFLGVALVLLYVYEPRQTEN